MGAAGDYAERLNWQRRTPGTPDSFGQRPDTFPSVADLWAAIEDSSGGRSSSKESEHQVITATIRVRQYPAIKAGDRLVSYRWGDVWTVDHVVRGENELLLEATRPRWTAGGGSAG